MGSKKGVVITVGILVAITIASFSVWIVNNSTNTEMTIVVTDFQNHQEGISERHKIISNAIETSFSKLINEQISADEYVRIAEVSSSQNNALLMELAYSDAPEEWQESYINRIASLKSFEAYIIETMVMANLMNNDGDVEQRNEILNNIEKLKEESIQYGELANSSKP
jgi:Tfp pilus assembly protein PilE